MGPTGDKMTEGPHVSEQVDVPVGVPLVVTKFTHTVRHEAGIARQNVDRAEVAFDLFVVAVDRSLVADHDAPAYATDLLCDCGGASAVEISDVHDRRAVGGEAPSHGSTDTACGSGDNDDCSLNLHGADRRPFGSLEGFPQELGDRVSEAWSRVRP